MFDGMGWKTASNDQIDQAIDHFAGLNAAALARVCELIREVDARQSWMIDGARNLTDWVSSRLRIRHQKAAQLVGVSRRLTDLPALSQSFATGELSLDQVDAISRMATPSTERGLIEEALGLSNSALDLKARRQLGLSDDAAESVHERRRLFRQWNLDESELRFGGNLPADAGRLFDAAIDERIEDFGPNPETGMFDLYETRAADALTSLAAEQSEVHLTVFAERDALTTTADGSAELGNTAQIPNETARRLGCEAAVRTIITEGRQPVGVGRRSRQIPGWLRDIVSFRDGDQCQFPGCRNTRWLQIHHVQHWADGGPTDLENLIVLCGFHHRFLHEKRWHITRREDRWQFRKPDWSLHPRPRVSMDSRLRELVRSP